MIILIKLAIAAILLIVTVLAFVNLKNANSEYSVKYIDFLSGYNVYGELKKLEDNFLICRGGVVLMLLLDVLFTLSVLFIC